MKIGETKRDLPFLKKSVHAKAFTIFSIPPENFTTQSDIITICISRNVIALIDLVPIGPIVQKHLSRAAPTPVNIGNTAGNRTF